MPIQPSVFPIATASIVLEPIGGSWLVAVVCVIALLVSPVLRWRSSDRSRNDRTLLLLRLIAAVVMLLLLLRPALIGEIEQTKDSVLTIALDQSMSMTLPDGRDVSRFESQRVAALALLGELDRRDVRGLTVDVIGYGDSVRQIDAAGLGELTAQDRQTNLSAVIEHVGNSQTNSAGLVLFGDGVRTSVAARGGNDLLRPAVRTIHSKGVPLFSVPVGPKNLETTVDVAIESLPESYKLFAGNNVDIRFVVSTSGVTAGEVDVEVVWIDEQSKVIPIATRTLVPTERSQSISMSISATVPPPGMYRVSVRSPARPRETVVTNNRQVAFAEVRDGGGRVLYLEGKRRQEQLFLRRSIRRFPDLDLTYQLIPASSSSSWPIRLSQQIDFDRFDAIIIGDLPAPSIDDSDWESIAGRVEKGMGLITLGGLASYEAGDYQRTPIAKVLPIELASRPPDPILGDITLRAAAVHPITKATGDSTRQWSNLLPMLGGNRLGDPKPLPGVKVVFDDGGENPMLVVGSFGRGRVASLAFDSTWRWWRGGDDKSHRRFWRQLLLWTLDRSGEDDVISIEMETRRLALGESSAFSASIETASGEPIGLRAKIIADKPSPSGNEFSAINVTGDPKGIAGSVGPLPPGIYRLIVEADVEPLSGETLSGETSSGEASNLPKPAEIAFEVVDRQIEFERPKPDTELLTQIAAMTSQNGGQSFTTDEMKKLADQIEQRQNASAVPQQSRRRLGDDSLTAWGLFLSLAVATGTQWILRRRWAMP